VPEEKTLRNGRYTLNRKIGAGSQAETYEARDNGVVRAPGALVDEWQRYVTRARRGETPSPQGLVAIKCFHVGQAKAWKDVELAEREATTLASLVHPNLPRYIEHFEEGGALYLVMEMVEGESLAELRRRQRTSSVAEVTRMLNDIADALRYLHSRAPAVVHRDIKPGNILRRNDGSYALVDFGAVRDRLKPEGGSTVVGTFGYMAPEQFQGRASTKSDLYGLGATALVMLTGVEPEDLPHVGLGIDVAKALPSGTPRALVRALASMLDPDPDRRAATVDDALAFLRETRRAPRREKPEAKAAAPKVDDRARRKDRRREARLEKRRLRTARHARRAPFVPRVVGQLGLLAALVVVWMTMGIAVPVVLMVLSLFLGKALRKAALGSRGVARRAQSALRRKAEWLAGYRDEDLAKARVRVSEEPGQVRVHAGAETAPGEEEEDDSEETDLDLPPSARRAATLPKSR
jgi:Protein kinase domain